MNGAQMSTFSRMMPFLYSNLLLGQAWVPGLNSGIAFSLGTNRRFLENDFCLLFHSDGETMNGWARWFFSNLSWELLLYL